MNALVCGAGGFIGNHLVNKLKQEDFYVVGADLVYPAYNKTNANEYHLCDLREPDWCDTLFDNYYDEVYQLAADMGGAEYIFTGLHDADIIHNSALINLNIIKRCVDNKVGKIFFSSSACVYNQYNQMFPNNPLCREDSALPAFPDSDYGWEKLFSEILYLAYNRNYKIPIAIARFHNIFGPYGAWNNGKEKAPAAICRKVAYAKAKELDSIDIFGYGKQTRSFLYIDECLIGVRKLMDSNFTGPVNIGSDEMVSIDTLAKMIMKIAGINLRINHIVGPTGVRGRTSDNTLIEQELNWRPTTKLYDGLVLLYKWIEEKVNETIQ
jgi:nucleoside-diphosphate-sugar epimerase